MSFLGHGLDIPSELYYNAGMDKPPFVRTTRGIHRLKAEERPLFHGTAEEEVRHQGWEEEE